jgi:hypothetical protein
MNDYDVETITREDRPGWRARIQIDISAGEPWGDALAPALVVPYDSKPYFGREVYVPADADSLLSVLRWYVERHGVHDGTDLFTRYLHMWCGTTADGSHSTRDGLVLVFDTPDWRSHVGLTDDHLPANLSGELAEWRAYFDGEIYGVTVERHRTGAVTWDDGTPDSIETWEPVESCWGFFGSEYAESEARRMLDEASAPATAPA